MFKKFLAALALMLLPLASFAGQYGTKDQAVAMVERATAYYDANGMDALIAAVIDPTNTDFRDRDLYVFVFDLDGMTVAHGAKPALMGKNLSGLKDQNGKALIADMSKLVQAQGSGWVDYIWPNPQTNKLQNKTSWVVKLGDNHFVGVGVYVQ